jgi:hypothetical protein
MPRVYVIFRQQLRSVRAVRAAGVRALTGLGGSLYGAVLRPNVPRAPRPWSFSPLRNCALEGLRV